MGVSWGANMSESVCGQLSRADGHVLDSFCSQNLMAGTLSTSCSACCFELSPLKVTPGKVYSIYTECVTLLSLLLCTLDVREGLFFHQSTNIHLCMQSTCRCYAMRAQSLVVLRCVHDPISVVYTTSASMPWGEQCQCNYLEKVDFLV